MRQHERSYIAAESRNEMAVYARKSTVISVAPLGAALTALGVIAALLGPTELSGFRGSPFGRVMVYLSVVVRFLMTLYRLFLVFSPAPRLVVSSEGIRINSPFVFRTGIAPWANMTSSRYVTFGVAPFAQQFGLLIELRDRPALRVRQNRVQAALYLVSGSSLLWPRAVVVNDTILNMTSAERLGRMRVRYGPELARHGINTPGGRF